MDRERGRKREWSQARLGKDEEKLDDAAMDDGDAGTLSKTQTKKQKRSKSEAARREASVTRGHSKPRSQSQVGLHSEDAIKAAKHLDRIARKGWEGGAGEGDNRKTVHLIQWCNTGKKQNGTHYQR